MVVEILLDDGVRNLQDDVVGILRDVRNSKTPLIGVLKTPPAGALKAVETSRSLVVEVLTVGVELLQAERVKQTRPLSSSF